jgi:hypothetical protein
MSEVWQIRFGKLAGWAGYELTLLVLIATLFSWAVKTMSDHFDTFAWLAGCGAWVVSTLAAFAVISVFNLNPFWLVITFPVPAIVVAGLYAYRLKSLPKLARQLGNLNKDERQKAFKQLMAMGKPAADVFLQVLTAPRKKEEIADWDGVAASTLAVEGLGRLREKRAIPVLLRLLKTSEGEICGTVIWALGEIGDDSVVPELLPFLGSESLNGVTVDALRKLGAGDLVELYKGAMSSDKTAIEAIKKHPYRKAFIAGFIRALWSREDISVIPKAAWALAELWAIEAIPSLRAQIARWLPTEIRQACKQALDKLEMISRLPRAVSPSEIDTSTLPRPAYATEFPVENLPSPANPHELNSSDFTEK